jgi:hypothetical protein
MYGITADAAHAVALADGCTYAADAVEEARRAAATAEELWLGAVRAHHARKDAETRAALEGAEEALDRAEEAARQLREAAR